MIQLRLRPVRAASQTKKFDRRLEQDLIDQQNPYYNTYVMGKNAGLWAYAEFAEASKARWHCYQSNWRILHIDGFEPGYGSRKVSFNWVLGAPYKLSENKDILADKVSD